MLFGVVLFGGFFLCLGFFNIFLVFCFVFWGGVFFVCYTSIGKNSDPPARLRKKNESK